MECKDSDGTVAWSYSMKSTQSRRINSDIVFRPPSGSPQLISSLQLAQYEMSVAELYMLLDDGFERISKVFFAKNPAVDWQADQSGAEGVFDCRRGDKHSQR